VINHCKSLKRSIKKFRRKKKLINIGNNLGKSKNRKEQEVQHKILKRHIKKKAIFLVKELEIKIRKQINSKYLHIL
jgi:hypothetical protein